MAEIEKYIEVPVARLVEAVEHPFSGAQWGIEKFTDDDIRNSLLHGHYEGHYHSYSHTLPMELKHLQDPNLMHAYHVNRIAYLVQHGWTEPIELDVGIPSLGYWRCPIVDGFHRLCAAMYQNHKTILSSVSGSLNYAFELFGVDCSMYPDVAA